MRRSGGPNRSGSIRYRTTSRTEERPYPTRVRNLGNLPSNPPLTSHGASCVSPTCMATHSIASADMKQPCGAKPARSSLPSMHWIVANHKREGAVSGSAAGQNCRPTSAMSVDFRTRRLRRCSARRTTDRKSNEIGFVSPGRPSHYQIVRRLSVMLSPITASGLHSKPCSVHRRLSVRAVERRITATSGWQENLIDQLIVFSFEWIDEHDALQRETILIIFGKQVPHPRTPCRSP